jgi:hypothetical protein
MAHGYSLRPNSKGRQRNQSADETKEQVEGTSTSTSTSTSSPSEGRHKTLPDEPKGESSTVDPRPATPVTPRAAHNSPGHSRSILVTSTLINASTAVTTTRYRVEGPLAPETREEIQAARKREEARRTAEAVRIQREQIARGYEEELRALRARIVALRRECEVKVERARRKWERDWAIERGEVVVVVEEGDGGERNLVGSDSDSDSDRENANGEMMVVEQNYADMEKSSLITNNDDDDDQQLWQWPSRSDAPTCGSHRSESNFPPPPRVRKTQQPQQQQQDDERGSAGETHTVSHTGTGRRLPRKDHSHPSQGRKSSHHSRLHGSQPQPLRRQPAQLMVIPTTSSHGSGTYGTAVMDP